MSDSGLTGLDKKWFDFTSIYVNKLDEFGGQDWGQLSPEEQELAALWKLEMDMHNGGFIQFICNWGSACYGHAIRCLTKLNANQCLGIVTKQYSIVARLEDDKRIESLWDIPKYLTKKESTAIGKLDEKYWDNTDNIQEKTFKTYHHLTD